MIPLRSRRRRKVPPESEPPIGVRNGDVMELVGRTDLSLRLVPDDIAGFLLCHATVRVQCPQWNDWDSYPDPRAWVGACRIVNVKNGAVLVPENEHFDLSVFVFSSFASNLENEKIILY